MNEKLIQIALDDFDDTMKEVGGCSDGYCSVTGTAKGLHTNGGCRCSMNHSKAQLVMRAARRLRDQLHEAGYR